MANWLEERVHREQKGNGRTCTRTHFPKKHDDLLDSEGFQSRSGEDDTKYRILGDTQYPLGTTENYQYRIFYTAMAKTETKPILSLRLAESNS